MDTRNYLSKWAVGQSGPVWCDQVNEADEDVSHKNNQKPWNPGNSNSQGKRKLAGFNCTFIFSCLSLPFHTVGTLRNYDGDGNVNKKV